VAVAPDIGCSNSKCKEVDNCNRALIYKQNIAREVKSFGGTPQKGCGKFIPIKKD